MRPQIPAGLEFEELYPATERHGFILLDMTPDRVMIRFFQWDYRKEAPPGDRYAAAVPHQRMKRRLCALEKRGSAIGIRRHSERRR